MARTTSYKRPKNTKKDPASDVQLPGQAQEDHGCDRRSCGSERSRQYLWNLSAETGDQHLCTAEGCAGANPDILFMGVMYAVGALACFGYNQLMVRTSQTVVKEIRADLFSHVQKLPLKYFDAHTHGELMSRFTNDVDTISKR